MKKNDDGTFSLSKKQFEAFQAYQNKLQADKEIMSRRPQDIPNKISVQETTKAQEEEEARDQETEPSYDEEEEAFYNWYSQLSRSDQRHFRLSNRPAMKSVWR